MIILVGGPILIFELINAYQDPRDVENFIMNTIRDCPDYSRKNFLQNKCFIQCGIVGAILGIF